MKTDFPVFPHRQAVCLLHIGPSPSLASTPTDLCSAYNPDGRALYTDFLQRVSLPYRLISTKVSTLIPACCTCGRTQVRLPLPCPPHLPLSHSRAFCRQGGSLSHPSVLLIPEGPSPTSFVQEKANTSLRLLSWSTEKHLLAPVDQRKDFHFCMLSPVMAGL